MATTPTTLTLPKIPNPLNLFPKYRATAVQAGTHATSAVLNLKDVASGGVPTPDRLVSAVKAFDGFDHTIGDSKRLPLTKAFNKYYAGYEAAHLAVLGLVGSGLIPGARELVGKTQLEQAQSHFHDGLVSTADNTSKYNRYRADDWIDHSLNDAATGLVMLRKPAIALPLLKGLFDVKTTLAKSQKVDEGTVKRLDGLFDSANSILSGMIRKAEVAAAKARPATLPGAPESPEA